MGSGNCENGHGKTGGIAMRVLRGGVAKKQVQPVGGNQDPQVAATGNLGGVAGLATY